MRCVPAIFLCLLFAAPLGAQKEKREPLTEAQVEKIAEAGIDPNARVVLYTQFLNEHADAIKDMTNRAKSDARSSRLNDARPRKRPAAERVAHQPMLASIERQGFNKGQCPLCRVVHGREGV